VRGLGGGGGRNKQLGVVLNKHQVDVVCLEETINRSSQTCCWWRFLEEKILLGSGFQLKDTLEGCL